MPRLLLVDDNPSIHKIAETLLGSSSIELVCVSSAGEALMMLDSGERFDVALLDTAMPGMDGWELLSRMRKHPDSAFIPIAMMAGVLDTVDPEKLRNAPIQGFIKKPIELRELAERVQQLLATPVTLPEREEVQEEPSTLSPFATVPGTKFTNLPEFRGVVDGPPPEEIQPRQLASSNAMVAATDEIDETSVDDPDDQSDVLLLTPEDFWFEDAPIEPGSPEFLLAQATAQAMAEAGTEPEIELGASAPPLASMAPEDSIAPIALMDATLDLEELDMEALKDLPGEETPIRSYVPEVTEAPYLQQFDEPFSEPATVHPVPTEPILTDEAVEAIVMTHELPDEHDEDTLAIPGLALRAQALSTYAPAAVDFPAHEFLMEDMPAPALSELGESLDFEYLKPEAQPVESPAQPIFEEVASQTANVEPIEEPGFPSAATYALPIAALALPTFAALHAAVEAPLEAAPTPPAYVPAAATLAIPAALAPPRPAKVASGQESPRDAAALIQVLMSDPALMDTLTKAVVARLGDQALREIAWELMPELAEKLPR
jgi:CheY-like chemotaxis protein